MQRETATKSSLRSRYIVALALIAGLTIAAQVWLHSVIDSQQVDGNIINIAGRQRMLSQRIGKLALLLDESAHFHEPEVNMQAAQDLRKALDLWTTSHKGLLNGSAELKIPAEYPEHIRQNLQRLDPHHNAAVQAARQLLEHVDQPPPHDEELMHRITNKILDAEAQFLPLMHETVGLYEAENSIKLANLRNIQYFLGGFTFLILLIEAIFVFEPAARLIKRQIRDLEAKAEEARQATLAKDSFLANMSHEIRTPMTAILGYADLMLDPDQSPSDRVESVQTIRRNADHLLTIINDILDISKIQSGKLELESLDVSPAHLVEEVCSLLGVRAIEKGIQLRKHIDFPVPAKIKTDPVRARQILLNLVGNAIKFTEIGQVTIEIHTDDPDNPSTVSFKVTDSGIGMTPQQIERLFKPFQQADETMTRRFGGTGLGLSISGNLAKMLAGSIDVTSSPGNGSCFNLTIPVGIESPKLLHDQTQLSAQSAGETPAHTAGTVSLHGISVLLAEDGSTTNDWSPFTCAKPARRSISRGTASSPSRTHKPGTTTSS